jgi:phosphoserine phosphatase RsbU/P
MQTQPPNRRIATGRRIGSCGVLCLLLFLVVSRSLAQDLTIPAADSVRTFTPAWRYIPADDPAFASPTFDDSAWLIKRPGQLLPGAGTLRNPNPEYTWARLHLHQSTPTPLAIALTLGALSHYPYAVYANGTLIGVSPGFTEPVMQHNEPFPLTLPVASDITLAVRFFCPRQDVLSRFPIFSLRIGSPASLATAVRLIHFQDFSDAQVGPLIGAALFFAVTVFAATLFFARRSRQEYLWLALLAGFRTVWTIYGVFLLYGAASCTNFHLLLWRFAGCGGSAITLEFIPRLTNVKPLAVVRPIAYILAASPLLALYSEPLFQYSIILILILAMLIVAWYFVVALLQRNREAQLLSLPVALLYSATILIFCSLIFPSRFHFNGRLHVGAVGLDIDQIATCLIFLTVLGIIQHRFVKVSQAEQQSEADLQAARQIQKLLIPDNLPEVPGFAFTSVYQPALQVGGDFFQIIPIPTGAIVVLGDVSGKGIPAAMTVALVVGALRSIAEHTCSPAAILTALNLHLVGHSSGFTTCLILCLDPAAGTIIASSAGHLDPYLGGAVLPIQPSLPLGLTPDAEYEDQTFAFAPGNSLTLLTDGVVEAFHPHTRELFGFDRVLSISHLPATGIAGKVTAFTNASAPSDDITILTIACA